MIAGTSVPVSRAPGEGEQRPSSLIVTHVCGEAIKCDVEAIQHCEAEAMECKVEVPD